MKEITDKNDNDGVVNNYVARDKDRRLYLYQDKPYKDDGMWTGNMIARIKSSSFPFIKWTDKEPTHLNITIKINKNYVTFLYNGNWR